MEQGFDPEVKKYFRKIINSFSLGFLWLFANATAGLYFGLGLWGEGPVIYTIIFYTLSIGTLGLLLFYYYKLWRK
jgi:hypothetical protein